MTATRRTSPPEKSVIDCRARFGEFAISQHALIETYAVLTGMNARPRLSPAIVRLAMADLLTPAELIALSPTDYEICLKAAEVLAVTGGTVYDLLHIRAAEAWVAEQLMTLNAKHFRRLATGRPIAISEP